MGDTGEGPEVLEQDTELGGDGKGPIEARGGLWVMGPGKSPRWGTAQSVSVGTVPSCPFLSPVPSSVSEVTPLPV